MFSFHKPRVYRSSEGCCICRAKSSSSRFTDSQKYEEDSIKCFNLKRPRYGEICNACVLLVKRYKRLPEGSQRHWGHVVDARAGPGTKTITKHKRSKDERISNTTNGSKSLVSKEHHNGGKSIISEKFSKIFKKTKKLKATNTLKQISPLRLHNKYSKRSEGIRKDNNSEDNSLIAYNVPTIIPSSGIVYFQTQTRASSYRLKNFSKRILENENQLSVICGKSTIPIISGSKKRKKNLPQKNRKIFGIDTPFFDMSEWVERTTCCGVIYECIKWPSTIIIDSEYYKPCSDHNTVMSQEDIHSNQNTIKTNLLATFKVNIPSVTTAQPAAETTSVITLTSAAATSVAASTTTISNSNSMPVLKKHHLFFKRQSECFPTGENVSASISTKPFSSSLSIETTKTFETDNILQIKQSMSLLPRVNDNNSNVKSICNASSTSTPSTSLLNNNSNQKTSSFLHKIKSDAGKIVKNSIGKLNSAVRLKSQDFSDINHLVKTVDKSYLLTKATGITISNPIHIQESLKMLNNNTSSSTILTPAHLSPTASSTTSTKFSDNSSDSGFDENERKSVSPLQQDADITVRSPVQTLILASGVKVHGQQQNLAYAGNETAAKILQNRAQHCITIAARGNNSVLAPNHSVNVSTNDYSSTLKIVPTKGATVLGETSKVCTIYNNSIQHENGITTIVPASSLAACNQTAAMKASAPNTITITPAISTTQKRLAMSNPTSIHQSKIYQHRGNETSQLNTLNINLSNQNHFNTNLPNLSQKVILLKTTTTPGLANGNRNLI